MIGIFYNIHNVASDDAIETASVQNLPENNPGLDTTEANKPQHPELTGRSGFVQTTIQKSVGPTGRFGGFPGLFGPGLGGGGLGGGGINTFDTTRKYSVQSFVPFSKMIDFVGLGTASASASNLDRTSFGNAYMNPYGNIYPGIGGGQGFQNQIPPYGGAYPYPPSNRYPYSMYQYPGSGGYY